MGLFGWLSDIGLGDVESFIEDTYDGASGAVGGVTDGAGRIFNSSVGLTERLATGVGNTAEGIGNLVNSNTFTYLLIGGGLIFAYKLSKK